MNASNTPTREPMGVGGILGTTFRLYLKHFWLFFGMMALYFCGEFVAYVLGRFLPDFLGKEIVTDLIGMLFALVSMGGIIVISATLYSGGHITSVEALKQTGRRFWHVLVCALAWSLAFDISKISVTFSLVSVVLPLSAWTPNGIPPTESFLLSQLFPAVLVVVSLPFSSWLQTPWGRIAVGLLSWFLKPGTLWIRFILSALLPFAIYFAVRWTFVTMAALLEKPSIPGAFKESHELTRRRWWYIWGVLICFSVLIFLIKGIALTLIGCLLIWAKSDTPINVVDIVKSGGSYAFVDWGDSLSAIIGWVTSVVTALISPLWIIGITLLYLDLQRRKDPAHT